MQRRFRQTVRAALVTPGLERARTARKLKAQVLFGQVIQQMHKGKCRAEHEQGMPGPARRLEPRQRGFGIQCPGAIVSGLSDEGQSTTPDLASNRFEHVDRKSTRLNSSH